LFVSDLDGTLVGDAEALETLNHRLAQHRQTYGTQIAYATGRSLALYQSLAREQPLLPPDALIAAVGTEIYFDLAAGVADAGWSQRLAQHWSREQVLAIAARYADLTFQPTSEQGAFKVSCDLEASASERVLPQLEAELARQGLAVQLIYSSGQHLDIVPQQADKGAAVRYLQQVWGWEDDRTVVCGDSGNDIALLALENARGIAVGNAQPELRQWCAQRPSRDRYLAQAPCAAGILEGLRHWGWLDSP